MHLKLIQANLAFFDGKRAETRRLLDEYLTEIGGLKPNDSDAAMIRWLQAHSQERLEDRVQHLRSFIDQADAQSHYYRLAYQYLMDEDAYADRLDFATTEDRQPRQFMGVSLWKIGVFLLAGALIGFVTISFMTAGRDSDSIADSDDLLPTPSSQDSVDGASQLLDTSETLLMDSFRVSYPDGILQIAAIERFSERVIDTQTSNRINPVNGAKFYALRVSFECRTAICNAPPEADLFLRLVDDLLVPIRDDVMVAGEPMLEPIALGRSTAGWIIFEIPVNAVVLDLTVQSRDQRDPFDSVTITLPQPE